MRTTLYAALLVTLTTCFASGHARASAPVYGQLAAYGSLGRDLRTDEIAKIAQATQSCAFLEAEHVSAATINALGQILIHAGSSPEFQKSCLRVAYNRIGIDIDPQGYAELEDAISLSHHREQPFGSFGMLRAGVVQYVGNNFVDTRRSQAGLPPESERLKSVNDALTRGEWSSLWLRPLALVRPRYPTNPALRAALMKMLRRDQLVRSDDWSSSHPGQSQDEAMTQVDAENLPLVRAIVTANGYPDAGQVGRNGIAALFFLVQHAAQDRNLMKHALELASPLYKKGELPPVYFALLTDRVRILNHEEQVYGTQSGQDRNGWFMYPISSPSEVNQRRTAMFMAPLKLDQLPLQRWPAPSSQK